MDRRHFPVGIETFEKIRDRNFVYVDKTEFIHSLIFENNIYIIFKPMGFNLDTEYRTSRGRIDLLIKTKGYIYVIELKLNGTAEEAIAQIEGNEYALPSASDPRRMFKIGISFSKETRNIDRRVIA